SLQGALLDEALEFASKLWVTAKGKAMAALLRRKAEEGAAQTHEAVRMACEMLDSRERGTALMGLVPVIEKLPMSDLYAVWTHALHLLSNRTRHDLLSDLAVLLPVIPQLGGGQALEQATVALADIVARWP